MNHLKSLLATGVIFALATGVNLRAIADDTPPQDSKFKCSDGYDPDSDNSLHPPGQSPQVREIVNANANAEHEKSIAGQPAKGPEGGSASKPEGSSDSGGKSIDVKDDDKKDGDKKDSDKKDGDKKDDDKKDGDKKDGDKKDTDKKDTDKKDGDKKDGDKKDGDKKETDKKDGDKKETDKKDGDKKETDKKDGDKKETDKKDGDKKDSDKKDGDKKDGDKKDGDKKDTDKKDGDKKDTDKKDTDKKDDKSSQANTPLNQALYAIQSKNYQSSLTILSGLLVRDAKNAQVHYLLAVTCVGMRRYEEAKEHYNTVIKLSATNPRLSQLAEQGLKRISGSPQ